MREPQVQKEIANITAVKNHVEEWARGVAKDATPNKQKCAEKLQAKSCRRSLLKASRR